MESISMGAAPPTGWTLTSGYAEISARARSYEVKRAEWKSKWSWRAGGHRLWRVSTDGVGDGLGGPLP
eukprot:8252318-Lingulodinium_polyedra.AAC.1